MSLKPCIADYLAAGLLQWMAVFCALAAVVDLLGLGTHGPAEAARARLTGALLVAQVAAAWWCARRLDAGGGGRWLFFMLGGTLFWTSNALDKLVTFRPVGWPIAWAILMTVWGAARAWSHLRQRRRWERIRAQAENGLS